MSTHEMSLERGQQDQDRPRDLGAMLDRAFFMQEREEVSGTGCSVQSDGYKWRVDRRE